ASGQPINPYLGGRTELRNGPMDEEESGALPLTGTPRPGRFAKVHDGRSPGSRLIACGTRLPGSPVALFGAGSPLTVAGAAAALAVTKDRRKAAPRSLFSPKSGDHRAHIVAAGWLRRQAG